MWNKDIVFNQIEIFNRKNKKIKQKLLVLEINKNLNFLIKKVKLEI